MADRAERGQQGWRMTSGWGGMRLADWAENGEFDHQQDRWKMTAGRRGENLNASRVSVYQR